MITVDASLVHAHVPQILNVLQASIATVEFVFKEDNVALVRQDTSVYLDVAQAHLLMLLEMNCNDQTITLYVTLQIFRIFQLIK